MNVRERLIVALDFDTAGKALAMVEKLKKHVRFFKVGFELFSSCGPSIVEAIKEKNCEIFLDLKFHDIPNTVAKAAVSAARLGVNMINVHALGGFDMMKETALRVAMEAEKMIVDRPMIIAVTVLTSMDEHALKKVGINFDMKSEVLKLAKLAKDAGLDGVVASPSEAALIRSEIGEGFLIVTPGVRPSWAQAHDQKRIALPGEAIKNGADFIVVGRPVTEASDPVSAVEEIFKEMEQ
ncbi:MAG: orotidine-5'-phosphate decarboxylase [Candidatus Omnitrophota bacterium]|jgi:orotidine-5'-phosphate decarboxylase